MAPQTLRIILTRDVFHPAWTLGTVSLDLPDDGLGPLPFGYSVEDVDRRVEEDPARKVKGQTAIPTGTYEVHRTWSPKFNRLVPLVDGVPGFAGVRIHAGNDAEDTEGCLLVGLARDVEHGQVARSRAACAWLEGEIHRVEGLGGRTILEVRRAPWASTPEALAASPEGATRAH